ncbi:uncharacterized protein PSFLO_06035 [Pseudozyma flocculosa]|uniref:Zn(2)-C6 fungal-type domain-containing protein n=1 Tax=Pseudozyma flocculosa TaxID=84751 RepID=A0A5C3F7X7_9BASI|nr:uncharacterized protein PSFLO_06035 [Pseudozyma flocculosa]
MRPPSQPVGANGATVTSTPSPLSSSSNSVGSPANASTSAAATAASTAMATTPATATGLAPQRPRRTNAKRSCLECRSKKARCELPNLHVPSSRQPVPDHQRCHRCSVLQIDCVVWDGDRKRTPRLPPPPPTSDLDTLAAAADARPAKRSRPSSPGNPACRSSSHSTPHGLEAGAGRNDGGAGPIRSRRSRSNSSVLRDQPASSHATTLASLLRSPSMAADAADSIPTSPAAVSAAAGTTARDLLFFGPPRRPSSADPDGHRHPSDSHAPYGDGPDDDGRADRGPPTADRRPSLRAPHLHHGDGRRSLDPWPATAATAASADEDHDGGRKSVWSPFSVLLGYASTQDAFLAHLLERIASPAPSLGVIDIVDTLDEQTCLSLEPHLEPYLCWHPHMPLLGTAFVEHRQHPTKSSSLLLVTLALLAVRHREPLSGPLPRQLSGAVDRLGTQVLVSTPRSFHTAVALELLVAHEPALVGTAAAGPSIQDQALRGRDLAGQNLVAAALNICRDVGIDEAPHRVAALLDLSARTPEQQRQVERLAASASLWISLRLWEGHYALIRPLIRPLTDLEGLSRSAQLLVRRDSVGDEIVPKPQRDPSAPGADDRASAAATEELERSAGRTLLAFRMRGMASFHAALSSIETVIHHYNENRAGVEPDRSSSGGDRAGRDWVDADHANDHEHHHDHNPKQRDRTSTSPQRRKAAMRQRIVDVVLEAYERRKADHDAQRTAMAVFVRNGVGLLVEAWCQIESTSLYSRLGLLGNLALYSGQLSHAFSPKSLMRALISSPELREPLYKVGAQHTQLASMAVSSFVLFDRPLTAVQPFRFAGVPSEGAVEATGAPACLTAAFIVDACKAFIEGIACALQIYGRPYDESDQQIILMAQAHRRLYESDSNHLVFSRASASGAKLGLRAAEAERSDGDGGGGGGGHLETMSISQTAAEYVRQMTGLMEKWRLAATIHRWAPARLVEDDPGRPDIEATEAIAAASDSARGRRSAARAGLAGAAGAGPAPGATPSVSSPTSDTLPASSSSAAAHAASAATFAAPADAWRVNRARDEAVVGGSGHSGFAFQMPIEGTGAGGGGNGNIGVDGATWTSPLGPGWLTTPLAAAPMSDRTPSSGYWQPDPTDQYEFQEWAFGQGGASMLPADIASSLHDVPPGLDSLFEDLFPSSATGAAPAMAPPSSATHAAPSHDGFGMIHHRSGGGGDFQHHHDMGRTMR